MKRFAILCSALLVLLVLSGCGSSGKNFPVAHVDDIQIGVTTQAQVLEWFGVAFKEGFSGGNVMWTYQFDTWKMIGGDKSKELVVLFDKENLVKAYRYATNLD